MRALALLVAFGCSGANGDHDPQEPSDPVADEDPGSPPVEEDPRPPVDPDTVCGRALACCRAYAAAIPNVVEESACAGIYDAIEGPSPDASCARMSRGWREALARMSEDGSAPPECGDGAPSS